MNGLYEFMLHNPYFVLVGAVTIIQISPIKINPWTALLRFIKNILLSDIQNDIKDIRKKVESMQADADKEKVERQRWDLLDFANSCRNGRKHSREEWKHCISQLKDYEQFCIDRSIENGVIEEDGKYLRELYHERNVKNDFI